MKVLIVNGSPRARGNSDAIVERICSQLPDGVQTTVLVVRDMDFSGCTGCNACKETGSCAIHDDASALTDAVKEHDVLVVVSPIYFMFLPGPLKTLLDRLYVHFDYEALENAANASKKLGIVFTSGTAPREALESIEQWCRANLAIVGFAPGQTVYCQQNLDRDGFAGKRDQQEQVDGLARWLVE